MPAVRRVYVLRLGVVEIDVAQLMPMEPERGERYTGPVTAFLISDDNRHILVDTGLSPDHIDDPTARIQPPLMTVQMRPEDHIVHQLGQIGITPTDIDAVINTHFHFDHCGGNSLFDHAPFYVQRSHYDWSANEDVPWRRDWDVAGLDYHLVDGDQRLFDGVEVVETPGHVPGHQSVVVSLEHTGTAILAGDAAQTHIMFEEERTVGMQDPEAGLVSIQKLKAIRDATGAQVLVCHDIDNAYRELPEYYD